MINIENVSHCYSHSASEEIYALRNVSLKINNGEFIAVLGHNGSGKSTFAKLLNALVLPATGNVIIDGINTQEEKDLWLIRSKVGMVFQNPDSQLVATTVEEELAFGPENIGVPREEMIKRIDFASRTIGLCSLMKSPPHLLSGGQKQRVAIASVLAMYPEYLVLDEPTAMLDPVGQNEILNTVRELNRKENITVIHITQNMSEAILFDRVIVMNKGEIVLDDNPRNVFSDIKYIESLKLEAPPMTQLAARLKKKGINISEKILDVDEMVIALTEISSN